MHFLARLLIAALSLGLAAAIVPGIHVDGLTTLLLAAFLLGIVNAILKPVAVLLTLPLTLLTLGLFLLVINAAMFAFTAWILPGFFVSGFWSALLGSLLTSFFGWLASRFL